MKNRVSKYLTKKCALELRIVIENFNYDKITDVQHMTGVTGRLWQAVGSEFDALQLILIDFELLPDNKTEATCYIFVSIGYNPSDALPALHQLQLFIDKYSARLADTDVTPAKLRMDGVSKAFRLQASKRAEFLGDKLDASIFFNPLRKKVLRVIADVHENCTGTLCIELK